MTTKKNPPRTMWDTWLVVAVLTVTIYSVLLVVAGDGVAAGFDRLGFGMSDADITESPMRAYVVFIYGVLGAVILGWMTLLLFVVLRPLRRREPWAWWAVVVSTGLWFAVDTGLSLTSGSPQHAAFNVVFLVALGIPLTAMAPAVTFRRALNDRNPYQ